MQSKCRKRFKLFHSAPCVQRVEIVLRAVGPLIYVEKTVLRPRRAVRVLANTRALPAAFCI